MLPPLSTLFPLQSISQNRQHHISSWGGATRRPILIGDHKAHYEVTEALRASQFIPLIDSSTGARIATRPVDASGPKARIALASRVLENSGTGARVTSRPFFRTDPRSDASGEQAPFAETADRHAARFDSPL